MRIQMFASVERRACRRKDASLELLVSFTDDSDMWSGGGGEAWLSLHWRPYSD